MNCKHTFGGCDLLFLQTSFCFFVCLLRIVFEGSSFDTLALTWTVPRVTNGMIVGYQLQRNNSTPWSFSPEDPMVNIASPIHPFCHLLPQLPIKSRLYLFFEYCVDN